jgi:hypothetical protein
MGLFMSAAFFGTYTRIFVSRMTVCTQIIMAVARILLAALNSRTGAGCQRFCHAKNPAHGRNCHHHPSNPIRLRLGHLGFLTGEYMKRHVIKHEYNNGEKLLSPELWCGKTSEPNQWMFQDAQHAALAAGKSSIAPCKNCIKAIIKQLQAEL